MIRMSRPRRRTVLRAAVAAAPALALASAVFAAAPAQAADEGEPVTRWSVSPADENGKDGRISIQHEADPGESITERIVVSNLGDVDAVFRLSAADGFTNASGHFDMLASGTESVDAGTWIDIDDEVAIDAGESAVVPFEITVPEQAEPGDHPAGVAASVISTQSSDGGASVGVESRVGIKVITRVTGEITPSMTVDAVSADYRGSWNPFRAGSVDLTFTLTNTGNTKLSAEGVASAGTGEAAFPDGDPISDLLPGDTREVTVTIDNIWPTFYASGDVTVTPAAEALDGTAPAVEQASAGFGVWAMPWPQLLVLVALALIVIALTWNRRRGKRRLDALLAEAREEGRRDAGTAESTRAGVARRGAAVALAAVAAVVLAPAAAVAADDVAEDNGGVGVHVTITERDGADADGADTDGGDTDGGTDAGTDTDDAGSDGGTDAGSDGGTDADGADADTDGTGADNADADTGDADGADVDTDGTGAGNADSADGDTDAADGAGDSDDQGDGLAVTGLDPAALITVGAAAVIAGGIGIALVRRRAAR